MSGQNDKLRELYRALLAEEEKHTDAWTANFAKRLTEEHKKGTIVLSDKVHSSIADRRGWLISAQRFATIATSLVLIVVCGYRWQEDKEPKPSYQPPQNFEGTRQATGGGGGGVFDRAFSTPSARTARVRSSVSPARSSAATADTENAAPRAATQANATSQADSGQLEFQRQQEAFRVALERQQRQQQQQRQQINRQADDQREEAIMAAKRPVVRWSPIKARVAAVHGDALTIAAGAKAGVAIGDRFQLFSGDATIKSPSRSSQGVARTGTPLGTLVIKSVHKGIAKGTYTGKLGVKVGDIAKR